MEEIRNFQNIYLEYKNNSLNFHNLILNINKFNNILIFQIISKCLKLKRKKSHPEREIGKYNKKQERERKQEREKKTGESVCV